MYFQHLDTPLVRGALRFLWLIAWLIAPLTAPGLYDEALAPRTVVFGLAGLLGLAVFLSNPWVSSALLISFICFYHFDISSVLFECLAYALPLAVALACARRNTLLGLAPSRHVALRWLRSPLLFAAFFAALPMYFPVASPSISVFLMPVCLLLWASMPRERSLLRELGWTLGGAMCFLALLGGTLEAGARLLFRDRPPNQCFRPHPERLVELQPGADAVFTKPGFATPPARVRVSPQGLRDRVYGPKAPGVVRVLALGDSMTFGAGVAEEASFPKRLESLLAEKHGEGKCEVINAGTPTYGPWQSLSWLKEYGTQFEPDLVLYALYPVNDAGNELQRVGKRFKCYDPAWEMQLRDYARRNLPPERLDYWMRTHSRVYQSLIFSNPESERPLLKLAYNMRAFKSMEAEPLPLPESGVVSMELNRLEWYPELEASLLLVQESVATMRDYCQARGWRFAVCILPSEVVSVRGSYEWQRAQCPWPTASFERARESAVFSEALVALGIPTYSMLDAFRKHPAPHELFIPEDGHFTEGGNLFTAKQLLPYVEMTLAGTL